ncbi:hypothetical protein P885DRAFT_74851 [Corynascus similis CBS 632.67]
MRIPKLEGWLVAVALAWGTAEGAYVTFDRGFEGDFPGKQGAAVFYPANIASRLFEWTSSSGVIVESIALYSFGDLGPASSKMIGFGKRSGSGTRGNGMNLDSDSKTWGHSSAGASNLAGRRDPPFDNRPGGAFSIELHVESRTDGGSVFLGELGPDLDSLYDTLYFEAIWDNGRSYSRVFTTRQPETDPLDAALIAGSVYFNATSYKQESGSPATEQSSGDITPQNPGLAGGGSNSSDNEDMGGSPTTPSPGLAVGGGGGLARGAVIGIAVGCAVAGLLIIAGLAWYLLRRHRRKKALQSVDSSYGPDNRGNEVLMAEKEAAADVDVTPHSPYSDDGVSGGPGGAGAGPGGSYPEEAAVVASAVGTAAAAPPPPHLQDPPRSFTPYSDRPSAGAGAAPAAGTPSVRAASLAQTDDARVSVPSPVPGRATPRALTTPYAHLVEDGMTEEEIRRLEEEERQLDAAIEQAGRR